MVTVSLPIEVLILIVGTVIGGIGTIIGWFIHDYVKLRKRVETIRQFLFGPKDSKESGLELQVEDLDNRLDRVEKLLYKMIEAMDDNGFSVESPEEPGKELGHDDG